MPKGKPTKKMLKQLERGRELERLVERLNGCLRVMNARLGGVQEIYQVVNYMREVQDALVDDLPQTAGEDHD